MATSTHTSYDALAWRRWATQHRLASAMLGGLIGVHIASVLGFWFGSFGLTRLDWNTANGLVYWPDGAPMQQFLVGWAMHYIDGIVFAVLFAVALHPLMPWRNTIVGNLAKALVFGTILAVVALLILTPLVYAPPRGVEAGFFSSNFGWQYILGNFLFHWAYGLHLGLIYNPLPDDEAEDLTGPRSMARSPERVPGRPGGTPDDG